jgi:hypothetical protein
MRLFDKAKPIRSVALPELSGLMGFKEGDYTLALGQDPDTEEFRTGIAARG